MVADREINEAARKELSRLICENRPNSAYTTEKWVNMAQKIAQNLIIQKLSTKTKTLMYV